MLRMDNEIHWCFVLLCVLLLLSLSLSKNLTEVPGDFMLGGLFPIHGMTDGQCSHINEQDGIQRLEAALFSLDHINNGGRLPGFTIGLIAADTCYSKNLALENSLSFAQKRLTSGNSSDINSNCDSCKCSDGSVPVFDGIRQSGSQNKIIGVIGPATSEESVPVATLLRLFQVPQISYFATSPELEDRQTFPYFKRTVPSDYYQARAIVQILRYSGWNFVSAIYEDSNYGINGFAEIEKVASYTEICFGLKEKVPPSISDEDLQSLADRLVMFRNKNGQVVTILYTQYDLAMRIQEAVRNLYGNQAVIWVGSDAWIARDVEGTPSTASNIIPVGTVGVTPETQILPDFAKYFRDLKPSTNVRDVWFREYWESHFNCRFDNSLAVQEKLPLCNEDTAWEQGGKFQEFPTLYSVRNAIFAFGQAMKDIHQRYCGTTQGICPEMRKNLTGETILHFLGNIKDPFGVDFTFINRSEGPPHYSILQYIKEDTRFVWKTIGRYSEQNGDISFDIDETEWKPKPSVCAENCQIGKHRVRTSDCCWTCTECESFEYINVSNPYLCQRCPEGEVANDYRNNCVAKTIVTLSFNDPFATFACVFSAIGMVASVFVVVIFYRKRETPIVKASSFEASMILLIGIFVSYSSTFVVFSKPTPVTCGLVRFFLGLSFTIAYAAIVSKLVILYYVFDTIVVSNNIPGQKNVTKKKIMSPKAPILISAVLIMIHMAVIISWMILDPPNSVQIYSTERTLELVCGDAVSYTYLIILSWPFLLMLCCLIFAIKTRKLPDGFNESHHVAYCAYTSFLLWAAFVPSYVLRESNTLRVIFLWSALSIHATVCLCVLFFSKIYIIIRRPEKNTRDRVMSRASPAASGLRSSISSYSYNPSRRGSDVRGDRDVQLKRLSTGQCNKAVEATQNSNTSADDSESQVKQAVHRTSTLPFSGGISRDDSLTKTRTHINNDDVFLHSNKESFSSANSNKDQLHSHEKDNNIMPCDFQASLGFKRKSRTYLQMDDAMSNSSLSVDTGGTNSKRNSYRNNTLPYKRSDEPHQWE